MTSDDLDIIVSSVAPVMREFVAHKMEGFMDLMAAMERRMATLEVQAAVPGPEGKPGPPGESVMGPTGPKGDPGKDADESMITALETKILVLCDELAMKEATLKSWLLSEVATMPLPQNGKDGKDGEPGPAGRDADPVVLTAFEDALQALRGELERKTSVPTMTVDEADAVSQSVEALFRKELGLQETRVVRKQKRVVRDADGKIDRVVEETVS